MTRWENALNELQIAHLVEARGNKGEIFGVIKKGVDFYKQLELKADGKLMDIKRDESPFNMVKYVYTLR